MRFNFWKRKTSKQETERSPMLDENWEITDPSIARDVEEKVYRTFAHRRLNDAKGDVMMYEWYKNQMGEIVKALDCEDVERALDILYSWEIPFEELEADPYLGVNPTSADDITTGWEDAFEEWKEEDRKLIQEKGYAAFRDKVIQSAKKQFQSDTIDQLLADARAKVSEMEYTIAYNTPMDAALSFKRYGDIHAFWAIKKAVLKKDYGIDWKTPTERGSDFIYEGFGG